MSKARRVYIIKIQNDISGVYSTAAKCAKAALETVRNIGTKEDVAHMLITMTEAEFIEAITLILRQGHEWTRGIDNDGVKLYVSMESHLAK